MAHDDEASEPAREDSGAAEEGAAEKEGRLIVGLANRGSVRWVAAEMTPVVEEARERLDLSPIAAVALGRALTAATLVQRISLKASSKVVLEVIGDGPLGKVVAEVDAEGNLRGLVGQPQLATPEDGRMKIGSVIGEGILRVTREGRKNRYSSQVKLVTGELGGDLTHYLDQSEQIRSAVLLGVLPRPMGVAAAGGLVVEALPGTEDDVVARLEENISALDGVSESLEIGGIRELVSRVLDGFDQDILEEKGLRYHCACTRQSLHSQLLPLARTDLEALLGEAGECEAVCAFCGARYIFTAAELTTAH